MKTTKTAARWTARDEADFQARLQRLAASARQIEANLAAARARGDADAVELCEVGLRQVEEARRGW